MIKIPLIQPRYIFAFLFVVIYVAVIQITHNTDYFINSFPFGIILWFIAWISWLFGGPIMALINTLIFVGLLGFLYGLILEWVIRKILK